MGDGGRRGRGIWGGEEMELGLPGVEIREHEGGKERRRKERAVQFINLSQLEALYARYSIS
jgi:hypothetical protein